MSVSTSFAICTKSYHTLPFNVNELHEREHLSVWILGSEHVSTPFSPDPLARCGSSCCAAVIDFVYPLCFTGPSVANLLQKVKPPSRQRKSQAPGGKQIPKHSVFSKAGSYILVSVFQKYRGFSMFLFIHSQCVFADLFLAPLTCCVASLSLNWLHCSRVACTDSSHCLRLFIPCFCVGHLVPQQTEMRRAPSRLEWQLTVVGEGGTEDWFDATWDFTEESICSLPPMPDWTCTWPCFLVQRITSPWNILSSSLVKTG